MSKSRLFQLFLCFVILISISACDGEEEVSPVENEDYPKVILLEDLSDVDTGDAYEIYSAAMDGNILELCIEFSGGCENHVFEMFAEEMFAESYPVQTWAKIRHDDSGDSCEALVHDCINFDLEPLESAYIDYYQSSEGTIIIHLEGFEDPIEYTF